MKKKYVRLFLKRKWPLKTITRLFKLIQFALWCKTRERESMADDAEEQDKHADGKGQEAATRDVSHYLVRVVLI